MSNYLPGVIEQMLEARDTCRELATLLMEENNNLSHSTKLDAVETRLAMKKRLSLRLEKLVQEIKGQRDMWKASPKAQNLAIQLAEEIKLFQELSAKNVAALKAAHQLRADIVAVIRDTLEAQQPKVQTYNRTGTLTTGPSTTSVVVKQG